MNRINGGKLLREDGSVEHDNIIGCLTDFWVDKNKVSRLFVLTFEEDTDIDKLVGRGNSKEKLKLLNGDASSKTAFQSPTPYLELVEVTLFNNNKVGYTYVGHQL